MKKCDSDLKASLQQHTHLQNDGNDARKQVWFNSMPLNIVANYLHTRIRYLQNSLLDQ